MCRLLHLWTLVGTLVKCICILIDKCHDDVIWWDHMMSCMMSWWCHAWCYGWCHGDVMNDVMVMSWMMSWWCHAWCHDDVAISTLLFYPRCFGYIYYSCCSWWSSSWLVFVQVLNKNGGVFVGQKREHQQQEKKNTLNPCCSCNWLN